MTTLYGDLETFSPVNLKTGSTHNYADLAEVMLFLYAIDDGEVKCWDRTTGEPMPKDLANPLYNPDVELVFQNSHFDRTVLRRGDMGITLPVERFHDTMVQAMAHSLPGGLERIGQIIGLTEEQAKMKEGKKLIKLFCVPQGKDKTGRATRLTHPEEWATFIEYGKSDVTAMREAKRKLPMWNYRRGGRNRKLWNLDQKINDRGFAVDVEFATKAVLAAAEAQRVLKARVQDETLGQVESATKRDQLLKYILEEHGVTLPDLTSDTLKRRLEDPELPEAVRILIAIRLEAGMASSAKFKALLAAVSADGRLRNALQFAGAMRTGRWAGRVFQPQNMKRPDLDAWMIDLMIEAILYGALDLATDEPMRALANVVRGCIIAPEGKKLCIADLSNIEGRVLVWLAGEQWKLQAFREIDAGIGHDMYKQAYAKSFNTDPKLVNKDQRQIGKVMELACLTERTKVLTNNGVKAIVEVSTADLLWDGMSWVKHKGLVERGVKRVVNVAGIKLTPDHMVLTNGTWMQARELATCENTLSQALATGSENLPSSGFHGNAVGRATTPWSKFSALAALRRIWCSITTYAKAPAPGAIAAPRSRQDTGARHSGLTLMSSRMTHTDAGYSTEFQPAQTGATTKTIRPTQTTVGAASRFTNLGGRIAAAFLPTLSRWKVGILPVWNLTGLTSTRATRRTICGSSPEKLTRVTGVLSALYRRVSPSWKTTFDISNAGPLHRFTVISDRGPLIVHNCGYEGGVGAFLTFAAVYNMDLDKLADAVWATATEDALAQGEAMYNWTVKKKRSTFGLEKNVWVACEVIKKSWRDAHPAVCDLWAAAANAMRQAVKTPGVLFNAGEHIKVQRDGVWTRVRLPSGRVLCYLKVECTEDGQLSYMGVNSYTRQWSRIKTYGGKLGENWTQACALDVMTENMPEIEDRGYEIVLTVHDEVLTETPDEPAFSSEMLAELMSMVPGWAPGLPLAAAGFETHRYRKG